MKTTNSSLLLPHNLILYAKAKAYEITKEIESIEFIIQNTKEEKLFCEKYTRNFQAQLEYLRIIWNYEKMKRCLIKSKLNLECISHKPINLN